MRFSSSPLPLWLCVLVFYQVKATTSSQSSSFRRQLPFVSKKRVTLHHDENAATSASVNPLLLLRGGSTMAASSLASSSTSTSTATSSTNADSDALRAYRWQQQLYLQSRSMQLRQALLARGLDGLHHSPEALEEAKKHVPVDWDCALATREHPKSCLYSFDAEPGTKVVAPRDTTQWITLSALNRLRRNDPTKVEPLWHSQYSILATWLNPESEFSMYHHLNPAGSLLSFLLDSPIFLIGGMMFALSTAFLVTLPFWESLITTFLSSSLLWLQWPNWGRFVHAALPLKLLLGQMAWRFIGTILGKIYGDLRQRLVELECQMWEDCMPLTVLEGRMAKAAAAAAAAEAPAPVVDGESSLSEDDDDEINDAEVDAIIDDFEAESDASDDEEQDFVSAEDEDSSGEEGYFDAWQAFSDEDE